nr:Arl6 [Vischeria sp. CAUP Q 202]
MSWLKRLAGSLRLTKHEVGIVIVGLDNSGKTTLINQIKPKQKGGPSAAGVVETTPTVGFQMEQFTRNNIRFTVFDMSGQSRYRNLWEVYYTDVQAIIFVLDSTDRLRMCVAKDELEMLLQHASVRGRSIPILFFANKMDLPGSMSEVECMDALELAKVQAPWHITASNALTGDGVDDGIDWLAERLTGSASTK